MQTEKQGRFFAALVAVIWCSAVWIYYFLSNTGYYSQKLTSFGSYILGLLGISS